LPPDIPAVVMHLEAPCKPLVAVAAEAGETGI
jgi:hypothetical protein